MPGRRTCKQGLPLHIAIKIQGLGLVVQTHGDGWGHHRLVAQQAGIEESGGKGLAQRLANRAQATWYSVSKSVTRCVRSMSLITRCATSGPGSRGQERTRSDPWRIVRSIRAAQFRERSAERLATWADNIRWIA